MKSKCLKVDLLFIYIFIIMLFFDFTDLGFFKYIICFILLFLFKRIKLKQQDLIKVKAISFPILILLLYTILNLFHTKITLYFIKDILLYITPFIIILFLNIKMKELSIDKTYIVDKTFFILNCFTLIRVFNWLILKKDFELFESADAFVYVLFCTYYFIQNKYVNCMISIGIILFYQKRIANIAVCLVFIFLIFNFIFKKTKLKAKTCIIAFLLIAISFGYIYCIKDNIITEFLFKNHILDMGRTNAWNRMSNYYSLSIFYFGQGIGFCSDKVIALGYNRMRLLHNDILKFYIELGFIWFIIYLLSYFKPLKYVKNEKDWTLFVSVLLAMIFIFFTDNISIYFTSLFIYYAIVFSLVYYNDF